MPYGCDSGGSQESGRTMVSGSLKCSQSSVSMLATSRWLNGGLTSLARHIT